jgi:protein-disulfide isomerase
VSANTKVQVRYDLNAQNRRRNLLIQIGLTAVVVVFAVALVLCILMSHGNDTKPAAGEAKAISVKSSHLITDPGTGQPKVVLSIYEDFLCPHCEEFEEMLGPTINQLIDTGAVAADYYMVSILDQQDRDYSSRASAAAYCVADQSIDAFQRFHAALYAQQPSENAAIFPDNAQLIEIAREAGVGGNVADCINRGKYTAMVRGLALTAHIGETPTVLINDDDYTHSLEAVIHKITSIVGNVPGVDVPAPAPPS